MSSQIPVIVHAASHAAARGAAQLNVPMLGIFLAVVLIPVWIASLRSRRQMKRKIKMKQQWVIESRMTRLFGPISLDHEIHRGSWN
jgi:hypothetical protein